MDNRSSRSTCWADDAGWRGEISPINEAMILEVVKLIDQANLLTPENQDKVKNHSNPQGLLSVLNLLYETNLLIQRNFDRVVYYIDALTIPGVLNDIPTHLLTQNVLDDLNDFCDDYKIAMVREKKLREYALSVKYPHGIPLEEYKKVISSMTGGASAITRFGVVCSSRKASGEDGASDDLVGSVDMRLSPS